MPLNRLPQMRLATLAIGLLFGARNGLPVHPAADDRFPVVLQFEVVDPRPEFSAALSRDVLLVVRRSNGRQGEAWGWDLTATDRRLSRARNFFYGCLCGHGPRPHDYYAWHFVDGYYPHERRLPVYGYPLEVRIRCPDCEAVGKEAADARFVKGTVEIGVRRLATANRRQSRISDIIGSRR